MADTDQQTMRHVLRREIAGTIGVLSDEHDFRAMRRYRTFTFDDHATYLQQVENLLRTRARQGSHTTLALFDPHEYAAYCTAKGLDADDPANRTRFTAELATTGPTVLYEGQPLTDLLPALVDEAVRQAAWEYAATLLARLGACATCGEDIGRAAFTRASDLLTRILDTAPRGDRHLVCSVTGTPETLVAVLHADDEADATGPLLDDAEALEFTTVLALGLATREPGRTGHAHQRSGRLRPDLRLAPARRRPGTPDCRGGLRRLLHRHRIRRTHLTRVGRRLLLPTGSRPPRTALGPRPLIDRAAPAYARGAPPEGGAPLHHRPAADRLRLLPGQHGLRRAARLIRTVAGPGGGRRPLALRQRVLRQRRRAHTESTPHPSKAR